MACLFVRLPESCTGLGLVSQSSTLLRNILSVAGGGCRAPSRAYKATFRSNMLFVACMEKTLESLSCVMITMGSFRVMIWERDGVHPIAASTKLIVCLETDYRSLHARFWIHVSRLKHRKPGTVVQFRYGCASLKIGSSGCRIAEDHSRNQEFGHGAVIGCWDSTKGHQKCL